MAIQVPVVGLGYSCSLAVEQFLPGSRTPLTARCLAAGGNTFCQRAATRS